MVFNRTAVNTLNNTRLLADKDVPYRLARTSLGSYFLYNIYVQLLFLLGATCANILLQCLFACEAVPSGLSALGWSLQDFSFEFIIMNLCLSTSIVFQAYETHGAVSIVSLVLCIGTNLLFIAYQLYRFNDFMRLEKLDVGDK